MIVEFKSDQIAENQDLASQMFRLRASLFSDRRGWSVEVQDGLERDNFDDLNPVYLCLVDEQSKKLLASLRLLPTNGPHMLSDVFPETMGSRGIIRSPHVWESSRFCVDTEAARRFCSDGINVVTRSILHGLFSRANEQDFANIISVYDVFVERVLRRAGCVFERLGPVVSYGGVGSVAGLFEVSPTVLANLEVSGETDRLAV